MSVLRRLRSCGLPCFVLFLLLVGHGAAAQEADIVYTEGWVDVRVRDGAVIEALLGDPVYVGDTVITDVGSRAELAAVDGTSIRIQPETIFTVREIERDGERRKVFTTILGAAQYRVEALTHKGALYATPTAAAGVRGTEFQVFAGPDGSSLIVVQSGEVSVTAEGESVLLLPDEAVEVPAGSPPGEKFPVLRGQLDFSAWSEAKAAEMGGDPVRAVRRIQSGMEALRDNVTDLLPRYEESRALLEREREKLAGVGEEKGRAAQAKYYTDVVFPLEIETSYLRLNLRYYALSALSFRRYVLGSMYVRVKSGLINDLSGQTFQAFRRTYEAIRDTFDSDIMPILVEADF